MNISRSLRQRVKRETEKLVVAMLIETDQEKLEALKKKYQMCSDVLEVKWKISPDTLFLGALNIGGMLLVLGYEKLDIISSKAWGLITKGRI